MKEYIERELLLIGVDGCISSLHAQAKGEPIQESAIKLVEATRDYIASFTAADVAPVRHGRWIEDERTYPGPGLKNNLCSACGEVAGAWKEGLAPERKWAYCPACGALMDGKEDEHEAG